VGAHAGETMYPVGSEEVSTITALNVSVALALSLSVCVCAERAE